MRMVRSISNITIRNYGHYYDFLCIDILAAPEEPVQDKDSEDEQKEEDTKRPTRSRKAKAQVQDKFSDDEEE